MDWKGKKFRYVRVRRKNNRETIEPIDRALHYGYYGKLSGERTIWVQPLDDNGQLMPVYYGPVMFRFAGKHPKNAQERLEYRLRPTLSSIQPAKDLISRLVEKKGIRYHEIDVFFAMPDFYISFGAEVFGLKPDPLFPRQCHRIAKEWAEDLGCDMSIYDGNAMMPLLGTKIYVPFDSSTYYATYIRTRDFMEETNHVLILVQGFRPNVVKWIDKERPRVTPTHDIAEDYHPTARPLHEPLLADIPPALNRALQVYHDKDELETLCFSVALAVKDVGGDPQDALAWINTIPGIDRLPESKRQRSVTNAFLLPYRFGFRTFAKYFPEFAEDVPDTKSPFFAFERKWLKQLLNNKVPYWVHTVLYQLMADFHEYPQPWRPLPVIYPKGRRQAQAIRILQDLGILLVKKERGQKLYHLNIDHDRRSRDYVRLPVDYLKRTLDAKEGVLLLSQLLVSSTGHKSYRRVHMKHETIENRLGISTRTFYNYLKKLREAGITISPSLNIRYESCSTDHPENP